MSIPKTPLPAQLILSVLSGPEHGLDQELLDPLTARLGRLDYTSQPLAFTETSYYDQELGRPISRWILGFETLVPTEELVQVKLFTNELEHRFSRANTTRVFNLDPGLISLERLVLASGKNFSHRLHLGQGIWGDLTLIFQNKDWQVLPWTFPDYAGVVLREILTELRNRYKAKLKP